MDYSIESCSLYNLETYKGKDIITFKEHNMALPIWGTYSTKIRQKLNMITFDSHTDTHSPFNSYLCENNVEQELFVKNIELPMIKSILSSKHYSTSYFSFEDIFKITVGYITNTEQILTAFDFGYLNSYTVIHRDGVGYEDDDLMNGYNAKYVEADNVFEFDFSSIPKPIALDFDLDYFRNRLDFSDSFFELITPLIEHASVITIAREPKFFDYCRNDETFSIVEAERLLKENIKRILDGTSI